MELAGLSAPKAESVDEVSEEGEEGKDGARLSVTQSDDPPLSGGHFAEGMSKAPLSNVRIPNARRSLIVDSPQARPRT